jgi:hypothetical protein
MRQRLALIAVEKNNVARFGLLFAQLQAQAHPFHLAFRLTSLQRVPGPPPAELFFARPWTVANGGCARPRALRSRREGGGSSSCAGRPAERIFV